MSADKVKSEPLPVVHGVWIHAKNHDDSQRISLLDSSCDDISSALSTSSGKSLSDLVSEWESAALRSKHSFTVNDDEHYALFVLHASADDKAVFLVKDETPFTSGLSLDEELPNSLLILPFLDGALVRFLERSQVYGVEMDSSVKRSTLKDMRSRRMLIVSFYIFIPFLFRSQ